MYKTILVPLDGSKLSENALPLAEAIAKRNLARMVLVRVAMAYSLGSDGLEIGQVQAVEEAETYLRRIADRFASQGVQAETAVPYGNAAEMILTEAHIHNPDLIIMGTHGRTGLGRLLLGSVADQVMRRANAPVLLIPARCLPFEVDRPEVPRVLVPVDGSGASERSLGPAGELGAALGAKVLLLEVANASDTGEPEPSPRAVILKLETGAPSHARDKAEGHLERLAAQVRQYGCPVEVHAITGDPATQVAAETMAQQVDVVVLASHLHGGLDRLVHGSIADALLKKAIVPMLVVRRGEANVSSPADRGALPVG